MASTPIRVCDDGAIDDGAARTVPAKDTGWTDTIAVFRDGGEYFALDDTCTHEEASLSEGFVEAGCVECPNHQSRFDLRTGAVRDLPATRPTRTHRVDVSDGGVWLYPGESPADRG